MLRDVRQLWILPMLSFILEWSHSSINFSLKKCFLQFHLENYCFNAFSCLVLTLNHKSVFSRSDNVTGSHSLLRHVILLLILIENVVLVVPQEKLSFTIVSITLLWAQSKKTRFWGSDDFIMMSQASRPKERQGTGSSLLSDT